MKIETQYDIGEKVKIRELSMPARITGIRFESKNENEYLYNVEYWLNGEIRSVWLCEDEIEL